MTDRAAGGEGAGARIAEGVWVEIHCVVLAPGERAPQVPPETQRVPLELRVKGVLLHDAALGDEAEIETVAGRRLRGTLARANPPYDHTFGPPERALRHVGPTLRALLRARRAGADASSAEPEAS